MSKYVKISNITNNKNEAIINCIEYIGKHYGNKRKSDRGKNIKRGKKYIAKKSRTSLRAVNNLMYGIPIKNSEAIEWRFEKRKYNAIYSNIVKLLLEKGRGGFEEARELLMRLMEEGVYKNNLSDILVRDQKVLLRWTEDKGQYERDRKYINNFLKNYEDKDFKYKVEDWELCI